MFYEREIDYWDWSYLDYFMLVINYGNDGKDKY